MVNILNENYEQLILNTLDTQDNLEDNDNNTTQIISHFTGIDPDGKSFVSLSGCKDEKCYEEIAPSNDIKTVNGPPNSGLVFYHTAIDKIKNYAPNKYFTLSTEERDNKQIFNIGRDDPYLSTYEKFNANGTPQDINGVDSLYGFPDSINYEGIKDENSVFRIEEEAGKADVFIRGDLHISGDFLVNGQNKFGTTINQTNIVSGGISQSLGGNVLEINATAHKNKKNIDGGFIIKRFQKESDRIYVEENFVLEQPEVSVANLNQPAVVSNFTSNKSSQYNSSNSDIIISSQQPSATNTDYYIAVIPGTSILPKSIQPSSTTTVSGYTREELGLDMIKIFNETGTELQVHWGQDASKHNQPSGNYNTKGWTPINLSSGNLVKDGQTNLFNIKFTKDSGHSQYINTDNQPSGFDAASISGIEIYHLKNSPTISTETDLNALGDVINIESEPEGVWSFKRATTADAFHYYNTAVDIQPESNNLGIQIPNNTEIEFLAEGFVISANPTVFYEQQTGFTKKYLQNHTDYSSLHNTLAGWYLVLCYDDGGNKRYIVRHINSAVCEEGPPAKLVVTIPELPEIPTSVYGWALFSKSHTGLIFDEGSDAFALTYLQKDNQDNILPSNYKQNSPDSLETIEKTNFAPLHVGPVYMNIADDETIPELSGKDLSIDLKGTGAETFKVNSGGQVFIRSNTYTGNNGIHIESTQGGVQIKSNKTLDLDGSSEIIIGSSTNSTIQIGGYQANTATIQSRRIHLAASSQQPESPADGVILLSGVVEEKVYTGKCIELYQSAQYKIKTEQADLVTITPTTNGDSCTMELNGPLVNVSDGTMKKNVETLENVSDKLRFQYRDDTPFDSDMVHLGIIAQEVEKVFPELVIDSNKGYKTMNYVSLTAVLLQALKEQQTQIDDLKKFIEKM